MAKNYFFPIDGKSENPLQILGFQFIGAILLILPIGSKVLSRSYSEMKKNRRSFYLGTLMGGLMIGFFTLIFGAIWVYFAFSGNVGKNVSVTYSFDAIYLLIFGIAGLFFASIYGFSAIYYSPRRFLQKRKKDKPTLEKWEGPTIAYLIIIILLLFWALGVSVSLIGKIEKLNAFSPILIVLLICLVLYFVFKIDHFYQLSPVAPPENKDELMVALKNRLALQKSKEKHIILLNFMGGASQSSIWSNMVMGKLQEQLNALSETNELGDQFTQSIVSISSTSGGSVGSMFYLSDFQNSGIPKGYAKKSTKNSKVNFLDSIGWGFAFLDIWRTTFAPVARIFFPNRDRGTSLEAEWDSLLLKSEMFGNQQSPPTLNDMKTPVLDGRTPIPIFNSIVVNDGRLLQISPLSLLPMSGKFDEVVDFQDHYHDKDNNTAYTVKLSTAARMSATFPFVSPISKGKTQFKEGQDFIKSKSFYTADGGYFANFGTFSSYMLLNYILAKKESLGVKKIMMVNVKAFPKPEYDLDGNGEASNFTGHSQSASQLTQMSIHESQSKSGLKALAMSVVGPVLALTAARTPNQILRNKFIEQTFEEGELFGDVKFESFNLVYPTFKLNKKCAKNYSPPYNWKLNRELHEINNEALSLMTDTENAAIEHADRPKDPQDKEFKKLVRTWTNWKMYDKNSERT